ncbi:MAG: HEAT repeat domain-containing protein [Chitinophagaceae bacterium]|nr:HEAT repeat domain-containing protein [Chitinophagaceae bacterium]MCW5926394.1 HEAT repeat domain-containing protein [Chitinophagaceae bacterium]
MKFFFLSCIVLFLLGSCKHSTHQIAETPAIRPPVIQDPSPQALSPEESIKAMHLPEGFRVEVVAAEPLVQEPVVMVWDGNGDMYVAEMRTYMQDIDATDENLPVSQVVKLEDTDGDGRMDKRIVFIDSLVLPRMLLPLDDRLLVQETYSTSIYSYRDTDGDGVADEKKVVYHSDIIDKRNLEHQNSGMIWNLDNWIYTTIKLRYRWTGDQLTIDSLRDVPWGQWGLANDNHGRLFLSSAGGETIAKDFQQMPAYGELNFYDLQYEEGFHEPWPIIATPDIEGGKKRLRADSTLNHFTGACGQTIYRGDRLPAYMQGDLFVCEPVGRLIRRARVDTVNGVRVLKNPYNKAEFLASTDMNFRPVNMTTGPDGCLYIVDMYRGIIQEGTWTGPSSYIRPQILRFGLDKNIGRGRIYRIVHESAEPSTEKPALLDASSGELVKYLSHPNGWWRDNAQKLLILRRDETVIPALKKLALAASSFPDKLVFWKEKPKLISRIHALWTLEGLQAADRELLLRLMKDGEPEIRRMAIWVSEPFIKKGDKEIMSHLQQLVSDRDIDVRIQVAQSLQHSTAGEARPLLDALVQKDPSPTGMVYQTAQLTLGNLTSALDVALHTEGLDEEEKKKVIRGAENYKSLCSSCHGPDGKGLKIGSDNMIAPSLAGSPRVTGDPGRLIRIVLSGLTGPIDGKEYPSIMPPQLNSDDEWLAEVLSYLRTNLGNHASTIKAEDIRGVRKVVGRRWDPWTLEELDAALKK